MRGYFLFETIHSRNKTEVFRALFQNNVDRQLHLNLPCFFQRPVNTFDPFDPIEYVKQAMELIES